MVRQKIVTLLNEVVKKPSSVIALRAIRGEGRLAEFLYKENISQKMHTCIYTFFSGQDV